MLKIGREERTAIVKLRGLGYTHEEIASKFDADISRQIGSYYVKELGEEGRGSD